MIELAVGAFGLVLAPSTRRWFVPEVLADNGTAKLITWQELQKHNHRKSCWLAIDGNVYE